MNTARSIRLVSLIAVLCLIVTPAVRGQAEKPDDQPKSQRPSPFIRPKAEPTTRPVAAITHVCVISIDGLRPDLLLLANTPNIHAMMLHGAYTMWARTTPNSITLPSHVSMMTGVSPRRHSIEWNRDFDLPEPIYPAVPTLLEAAKRHGYTTAVVAGKSKFEIFDRPGVLDWKWIPKTVQCETADVLPHAVEIIREHKPEVMLIHFPSVDNTGHAIGWASRQQMRAIEDADDAVGQVLNAIDDAGLTDSMLVIVTADHGGAGKDHGPDDPRSRHIPWVASGPKVRQHHDLTTYPRLEVTTYDTFATACWVLGIPPTVADLDGKPIKEIFPPQKGPDELLHAAAAVPAW